MTDGTKPQDPPRTQSIYNTNARPSGQFVGETLIPDKFAVWATGVYQYRPRRGAGQTPPAGPATPTFRGGGSVGPGPRLGAVAGLLSDRFVGDDASEAEDAAQAQSMGGGMDGDMDGDMDGGASSALLPPSIHATPPAGQLRDWVQLTTRPVWVTGFAERVDKLNSAAVPQELICVTTRRSRDDAEQNVWLPISKVLVKKHVEALSEEGLPIRSTAAQGLERYFEQSIAANRSRLPWRRLASRLGHYPIESDDPQAHGYLLSDGWIGDPTQAVEFDKRGRSPFNQGLYKSGSFAAWRDKFLEISALGIVSRWLTHSIFASPLLHILSARSFIIHHWGHTSAGKTALAQFAISAWGDPVQLKSTFNATDIAMTEMFGYLTDLPVLFDELQASTNKAHDTFIYNVCNEVGRLRAKPGGLLESSVDAYKTIVRTTGEEAIVGNLDLGGQTGRVLQVCAVGCTDAYAGEVHEWLHAKNFGTAGPKFLQYILDCQATDPGFYSLLRQYREDFSAQLDNAFPALRARRRHLAVVATCQWILYTMPELYALDPVEAQQRALADAFEISQLILDKDGEAKTPGERARQRLVGDFTANRGSWIDSEDPEEYARLKRAKTPSGLMGLVMRKTTTGAADDEVWLVPTTIRQQLSRAGFSESRVIADWKESGLLQRGRDKKSTQIRTIPRTDPQTYRRRARFFIMRAADFFAL